MPKPNSNNLQLALQVPATGTLWQVYIKPGKALQPNLAKLILETILDFELSFSRFNPGSIVYAYNNNLISLHQAASLSPVFNFLLKWGVYLNYLNPNFSLFSAKKQLEQNYGYTYNTAGKTLTWYYYNCPWLITKIKCFLQQKPIVYTNLSNYYLNSWEELKSYISRHFLEKPLKQGENIIAPVIENQKRETGLEPAGLDFGAVGKGYLIDLVSKILRDANVNEFKIWAGGDIYTQNLPKDKIYLEDPLNESKVFAKVISYNGALAASANNKRVLRAGKGHILNAGKGVLATFVQSSSALVADSLSTFYMLKGEVNASNLPPHETMLINKNKLKSSKGFKATLSSLSHNTTSARHPPNPFALLMHAN